MTKQERKEYFEEYDKEMTARAFFAEIDKQIAIYKEHKYTFLETGGSRDTIFDAFEKLSILYQVLKKAKET